MAAPPAPLAALGARALLGALAALAFLILAPAARADDAAWPRQFDSASGSFVIYQPQPEDLTGDLLTGRAAFSLKKDGDAYPTFGVIWFTERIAVDRDSSTVTARNFDVTRVRLPNITPALAGQYERQVETQAADWDLSGSLDELQAGLAAAEKERANVAGLDNSPPRIIFRERRAILVVYDGDPALEPIEGTDFERVANTPYAVLYDPARRAYYLNGANLWYRASDPLGPWSNIQGPPAAIREIMPPDTSSYDQIEGEPPLVLTATEPTELIATDGPPEYAPLVEDELLYVTNTESDVIREVSTQSLYVLLSGRWFRAPSQAGPWEYVPSDSLPESFRRVPPDSPKGNILASVAGTDQAEDALADAEIPQTSAIQRDAGGFEVFYDGDPEFEPIEGTDLEYAVNTDAEVILADGRYYACDQGVWYIADDPMGPWSVSDTRPVGIDDIPPDCPVYDVRYVYIYDSTPDVIYVGYVPGYMGCYPYRGTVVYGTGYRYRSWRSRHHYYPHRFTWGFHARYNPWLSRWSLGFSYWSGFLRVGTRWDPAPRLADRRVRSMWFGPGGYRRPWIAADNSFRRTRTERRIRTRTSDDLPANIYRRTGNVERVDRTAARVPLRTIARSFTKPAAVPNDVFAGKDGQVYRRDPKDGWQVREGRTWKPAVLPTPAPRPSPPPEGRRPEARPPARPPSPDTRPPRPDRPAVEPPAPPSEPRVTPRPPRESQPPPPREYQPPPSRPTPPSERPRPPAERPAQPERRPAPPPSRPMPGDLEREYRARQRSGSEENRGTPQPPPSARPTPPRPEPRNEKAQEPPKDRREERTKENARPDRKR